MSAKRHVNHGLRKVCGCPRKKWKDCLHPWHFNYKPRNQRNPKTEDGSYRLSLDRHVGRRLRSRAEAQKEAQRIKDLIDEGKFGAAAPVRQTLTVGELLDAYDRHVLRVRPGGTPVNYTTQLAVLKRTELVDVRGDRRPFGQWLVADVTSGTLLQYREVRQIKTVIADDGKPPRRVGGVIAVNRDLGLLRSVWNWAIVDGVVAESPFKRGIVTVVKVKTKEMHRTRRLQEGEEPRLLAACRPHLRALVEALLATGCRLGELLSLQWSDVVLQAGEIRLRATNTKTRSGRTVPISTRLRAILEMRRHGPNGKELPATAYVFGNEIGERVKGVKTAWYAALRRAGIVGLHLHDLRREAGSRWVDHGIPLHQVQSWLGHSNISQTSTYLATVAPRAHDAMRQFEERWAALQQNAKSTESGVPSGPDVSEIETPRPEPSPGDHGPH